MGLDDSSILDTAYLEAMADDEESADDLPPLAEFKALAEEIDDRCQAVVPSESRPIGPTAHSQRSRPQATSRTGNTASKSTSRRWQRLRSFRRPSTTKFCNHACNKDPPQCAHDAIESAIDEAADDDPVILWWDDGGYLRDIVEHASTQLCCEFRAAEQTPLGTPCRRATRPNRLVRSPAQ